MIFVFVIDTSPSMSRPVIGGMSRLDVAKMAVEDLTRQLRKQTQEHYRVLQQATQSQQRSLVNLGLHNAAPDRLLLLSTSRQYPDTASCAAGGRLLVGFGSEGDDSSNDPTHPPQHKSFFRELKTLQAATGDDAGGGALGLNAALSAGLQLLGRYRLQNKLTENFGMGRLPSPALITSNGAPATAALQPACLVLLTDGECLRQPGGSLQLQFGKQPLREFYQEPFRWDQRVVLLSFSSEVHTQLSSLVEVTGGSYWKIQDPNHLPTQAIMARLRPPLPVELPLPEPLYLKTQVNPLTSTATLVSGPGASFVQGGPVCCLQSLENDGTTPIQRALLLYTGSHATSSTESISPPLWCLPESFFPSKKLDTLPPRAAQPYLYYSKYPANLGSKSYEPLSMIKLLHRLDQLITTNRQLAGQPVRLLQRDVYVCEWLAPEGGRPVTVTLSRSAEYFPVIIPGAGRPTLADDGENYLNIGILHASGTTSTLAASANASRLATLTLLPPEPHILLPLLIRAAEAEHRVLKKSEQKKASVPLDDHWRSEFRAYLFRLPPYYQPSLRRALRVVLPSSVHSLLNNEGGVDAIPLQCFSKVCLQKILNGEQVARDSNERLERQEASLRRHGGPKEERPPQLRYGQFDPRGSICSYLAALRNMPPPWKVGQKKQEESTAKSESRSETASVRSDDAEIDNRMVTDVLGDLPAECLMAFYESRRRWIFGGSGLSTRGIHVEGVNNDGSNSQRCRTKPCEQEECLLSLAGVGVSMINQTTTTKMGDYRERLLFSRAPVVGYGSNDYAGVAITTAADGSPRWSVDDDAMPMTFFDAKTGEFTDSVQVRVRSRLMVNFGNPYKEKRADSLVPEVYLSQAPSMIKTEESVLGSPRSPTGSPPHDSFDSVEEGEAIFVMKSPSRSSPLRGEPDESQENEESFEPPFKRPRSDSFDLSEIADAKTDNHPVVQKEEKTQPLAPPLKEADSATKDVKEGRPPPPQITTTAAPPRPSIALKKPLPPSMASKPPLPKQLQQHLHSSAPRPPPPKPSASTPSSEIAKPAPNAATQLQTHVALTNTVSSTPTQQDLQRPDVKPTVVLPPGWMCVWSKSQKRWYFFNTKSNISVWEWPPQT